MIYGILSTDTKPAVLMTLPYSTAVFSSLSTRPHMHGSLWYEVCHIDDSAVFADASTAVLP